jgi:hypothetical protein
MNRASRVPAGQLYAKDPQLYAIVLILYNREQLPGLAYNARKHKKNADKPRERQKKEANQSPFKISCINPNIAIKNNIIALNIFSLIRRQSHTRCHTQHESPILHQRQIPIDHVSLAPWHTMQQHNFADRENANHSYHHRPLDAP